MSLLSTINDSQFLQLCNYIEQNCGIVLGNDKAYLIETRLTKLMLESGCNNFDEFYRKARYESDHKLRDQIVDAITTNETLWFRDEHPYLILRDIFLPECANRIKMNSQEKIRIWSAACSTGQEPYSIAITIHEFCRGQLTVNPDQFEIIATDISPSALMIAQAGRYNTFTMRRGMNDELRNRYFQKQDETWILDDTIKNMVTFKQFNLQDNFNTLGHFDIVFLRYVAIYFADQFKKALFSRVAQLFGKTGSMVIGATETLFSISNDFENHTYAGGKYYTIKL